MQMTVLVEDGVTMNHRGCLYMPHNATCSDKFKEKQCTELDIEGGEVGNVPICFHRFPSIFAAFFSAGRNVRVRLLK